MSGFPCSFPKQQATRLHSQSSSHISSYAQSGMRPRAAFACCAAAMTVGRAGKHAARTSRRIVSEILRRASQVSRAPVRKGTLSPIRKVPLEVQRPSYITSRPRLDVRTGLPVHPFLHCHEIKSPEQVAAMRRAGAVARETLLVAKEIIAPGVTTDSVDAACHDFIVSKGAYPSPLGYLDFPKSVSTSVNDVIAHGIPDDRPLEDGDIINVDITVFLDGHHGDTSSMFVVGEPDPEGLRLCQAAQRAQMAGIEVCRPGASFQEIGLHIQAATEALGFDVSDLFAGHGIGSYFHGYPEICHYANDLEQGDMMPGMIFTVEPVVLETAWGKSDDDYTLWDDKWTYQSLSNARSAQFEHTVLITETGYELLTGPSVVDFG